MNPVSVYVQEREHLVLVQQRVEDPEYRLRLVHRHEHGRLVVQVALCCILEGVGVQLETAVVPVVSARPENTSVWVWV